MKQFEANLDSAYSESKAGVEMVVESLGYGKGATMSQSSDSDVRRYFFNFHILC